MSLNLTNDQAAAFEKLKVFLKEDKPGIFILKGSAGTGKTTLVKTLVAFLKEYFDRQKQAEDLPEFTKSVPYRLLATTGRAAKILRDKTGTDTRTLHSIVYVFKKIEGSDHTGKDPWNSEQGQLFLDFEVNDTAHTQTKVFIVDEASMISSRDNLATHSAKYGSGNTLRDLCRVAGHGKIIFVGDPCQLPPVSEDVFSGALDAPFLMGFVGMEAREFSLKEVVRQAAGSEVIQIAERFRQIIESGQFEPFPKLPIPQNKNIFLEKGYYEMADHFVNLYKQEGPDKVIMLAYSNENVLRLNNYIRKSLHAKNELTEGDLLMVVQNSYTTGLVNGDQVMVQKIIDFQYHAGFTFVKVILKSLYTGDTVETLLLEKLLYNAQPGISPDDNKLLLMDFDRRMRNRNIGRNSEAYRQAMLNDELLNAIRAKFGYAVTVHKAQGGEWPHVFFYLDGSSFSRSFNPLTKEISPAGAEGLHRWLYTALTRTSDKLYVNDGFWIEDYTLRSLPEPLIISGAATLELDGFDEKKNAGGKTLLYCRGKLRYATGAEVSLSVNKNKLLKPFMIQKPGNYAVYVSRNDKGWPIVKIV